MSQEINNHSLVNESINTDFEIKYNPAAIKYLRIWLDAKLTWKEHVNKTVNKCDKIYWTIQSNLSALWGIKTNIAWQIPDACALSIIDYYLDYHWSMTKSMQEKLEKCFNKIVRKVYNLFPSVAIQHQLQILDFQCRWKNIAVDISLIYYDYLCLVSWSTYS